MVVAREASVEEAERRVAASLAAAEQQSVAAVAREESLRAREAMAAKLQAGLLACEGDLARREGQVSLREADTAA